MKKISIVLDQTEQQMVLVALMEKAWCSPEGSQARENYERLYGDFKEAIANGEKVNEQ